MLWVATDEDGTVCLFAVEPKRDSHPDRDGGFWADCDTGVESSYGRIELPDYVVHALFSNPPTWKDDPLFYSR